MNEHSTSLLLLLLSADFAFIVLHLILVGHCGLGISTRPHAFRKISNDMFLFIVVWAFFGLFTDLAAAIKLGPAGEFASDFVEDGGEMACF